MSARRRPIVLADEAQDDLHSIALNGLLNWGEEQADRYHAATAEMLNSLARFPELGRRENDLAHGVRVIGIGHHRILYRVDADAIRVLRILHERMNAPSLFDE